MKGDVMKIVVTASAFLLAEYAYMQLKKNGVV